MTQSIANNTVPLSSRERADDQSASPAPLHDATTIKRRIGRAPFDVRREQMLADVQKMSAHSWTDFNAHDPGITILEQLAYALTDIDYRTELDVEQLFADETGHLDLNAHGLYSPEQAFPCRPVNALDLQKYLLDCVPELAYVHVASGQLSGTIALTVAAQNQQIDNEWLIRRVKTAYHAVRNLAETLDSVKMIPRQSCVLNADIYLSAQCNPVLVLSRVYLFVEQFLLGDVRGTNASASQSSDFTGPRLTRQRISSEALHAAEQVRSISALIQVMMQIDGVQSLEQVSISNQGSSDMYADTYQHFLPAVTQQVFDLDTSEVALSQLRIYQNGKLMDIDVKQVHAEIINLDNHKHSQRDNNSLRDFSTSLDVASIDLAAYASIQYQFPSNYGINAYGVPSHADTVRVAQAKQLQGFLLLFDQVISDHAMMTSRAKHLFSCSLNDMDSYCSTEVVGPNPHAIRALRKKTQGPDFLQNQWGYDIHDDRKQRALDYLIAINGRDKELFSYEYTNPFLSQTEQAERTLLGAQCLLKNQHVLAENRSAAMNIQQAIWQTHNISVLAQQVNLRVSGELGRCQSLCAKTLAGNYVRTQAGQAVIHKRLPSLFFRVVKPQDLQTTEADRVPVPKVSVDKHEAQAVLNDFLAKRDTLSRTQREKLFYAGANLACYQIGHSRVDSNSKAKKSIDLVINIATEQDQSTYLYLASFSQLVEAALMANLLRQAILDEQSQIESLHLVEHILLAGKAVNGGQIDDHAFYPHQVTAILPDYSARLRDEKFRLYIEDIILRECPAHIYCHILWLNIDAMAEFEALYQPWLSGLSTDHCSDCTSNSSTDKATDKTTDSVSVSALSAQLTEFIQSRLSPRLEQS